jgi:hypothetical protein
VPQALTPVRDDPQSGRTARRYRYRLIKQLGSGDITS